MGWTLMVPVEGYYMHAVNKLLEMLRLGRLRIASHVIELKLI
jgi:hypothetical protein